VLREDSRAIVRAASQATKAANWLLAFLHGIDDRFGMAGDKQQATR
jgi:antirestriction protein ArdC